MKSLKYGLTNHTARFGSSESGFTLVELIVAVAIIIGLAGAIIPNVVAFASKGETGATRKEAMIVQDSMDAMMADMEITTMDAHDLSTNSTATNDYSAEPTGAGVATLDSYLRAPAKYLYCWDGGGLITEQFKSAAACTL